MKITCQSCQSRYNVADEKVQGKIVKIRCRKCGATIIVNGTEVAAGAGGGGASSSGGSSAAKAPTERSSAADAGAWHVNIAENEQRTMSMAELVDAYNAGVVTQDTFVWTEGMDDWKTLGEVDAVVAALHDGARQATNAAVGADAPSVTSGRESMLQEDGQTSVQPPYTASAVVGYGSTAEVGRSPYATSAAAFGQGAPVSAEGEKAVRAEPRRAALKREGRSRDLFASRADVFGSETSDVQGVQTSAPFASSLGGETQDDASKLTGQRNENSVLFSLAVLTKNAEERAPAGVSPAATNSEDSGLIDLKALAAKAESMMPEAAAFSPALGMSTIGSPMMGLGLGGTLGDLQPKSKLPLWIGGGAAAILLVVLGTVIGVQVAGNLGSTSAATAPSAVAAPPASTLAEPTASAPPSAAPVDSAAAAAAAAGSSPKPRPAGGGGGGYHPANPGGAKPANAGPATGAATATTTATAAPAAAPRKNDCGCNGDLMCLMKCSAGH
jgi:predicted Zn finger-like uncharacterized protein